MPGERRNCRRRTSRTDRRAAATSRPPRWILVFGVGWPCLLTAVDFGIDRPTMLIGWLGAGPAAAAMSGRWQRTAAAGALAVAAAVLCGAPEGIFGDGEHMVLIAAVAAVALSALAVVVRGRDLRADDDDVWRWEHRTSGARSGTVRYRQRSSAVRQVPPDAYSAARRPDRSAGRADPQPSFRSDRELQRRTGGPAPYQPARPIPQSRRAAAGRPGGPERAARRR